MKLTKNINRESIVLIRTTLNRLKLLNKFELSFLTSLLRINYSTLKVSPKQYSIFTNLYDRYRRLDIYERYIDWFRLNGFILDDYETAYLETYKGEFEKTEAFLRFQKQTINKPK